MHFVFLSFVYRVGALLLFVHIGNQKFAHHSEKDRKKLPGILKMVQVDITAYSVFVGNGVIPHAGASKNEVHPRQYHTYGPWFGRSSKLTVMDEGQGTGDANDKSKQDSISTSSNNDPEYPMLESGFVVIADEETSNSALQ